MSDATMESMIASARAYESLFVPALFGQWASRVADLARLAVGERVLDVACGTGVLAREAQRRTAPTGCVAGLDPGPGMLAVARELAPLVDWREGRAEAMPFADGAFDAVVSQFGLMFTDAGSAVREMLRVLRPGGPLVVAVWNDVENIPAYAAEIGVLERIAGPRAADALRAPFVLGRPDVLAGLFEDAGAGEVVIGAGAGVARFPSIRVMVEADLRGWLPVMGVNLGEEVIARVLDEADAVLSDHAGPDGTVEFATSALLVAARKP